MEDLACKSGSGVKRLVFATIAHGMGCDLRHVKQMFHAGPPSSMEAYVQEVDRAGRDGSMAETVLFYNPTDLCSPNISLKMKEFCKNRNICRMAIISEYFSALKGEAPTNCCDICQDTLSDIIMVTPTLKERQLMRDALNVYMHSSGKETTGLNGTYINIISDVLEFLYEEIQICNTFANLKDQVATTILQVKQAILSL